MHWAEVIADDLLKQDRNHILATGITPSGPIHIGNMREVLTTDAVYRSLRDKGANVELIYIADDYDHLRKVYPYLPDTYEEFVGMPICDIPCPCGEHKSYADHYLSFFLNSLKEIGIKPRVYRANEMYKKGDYFESIQIALENIEPIKRIIESISKRQLPKNWLPFNVRCQNCKRITGTKPMLYDFPIIEYKCECGHEGTVDIRQKDVGKLPWRIDWPARWKMLGVTFEPFGKDLGTVGGARQTGEKISQEIYNYPPPNYLMYEFIILKGMGAMHSSKGTALSAEEMLRMTPPEVLRFLIMKNHPTKHIVFDPGLGILNLVEEYDLNERVYFGLEEKNRGMKDLSATYELSQPYDIPKKIPVNVPYKHLVTVLQIGIKWNDIKDILIRTNQIPKDISVSDEKRLRKRVEHGKFWLKNYAPDEICFTIKKKLPKIKLDTAQKKFLSEILEIIPKIKWEPEDIHNAIYTASENAQIPIKTGFLTIYQLILGKEKGPRAGFFLSNLEKEFIITRFEEALK